MIGDFITVLEKEFDLQGGILLSQSILHDACIVRYMCYRYLHEELSWSASRIGRLFNRSRINVFRGIRILRHQMAFSSTLREQYCRLVQKIEETGVDSVPSAD